MICVGGEDGLADVAAGDHAGGELGVVGRRVRDVGGGERRVVREQRVVDLAKLLIERCGRRGEQLEIDGLPDRVGDFRELDVGGVGERSTAGERSEQRR